MNNNPLPLKLFVASHYISPIKDQWVEAYLIHIKAVPYKALMFTVYTEHGALYSNLPIEALFWDKTDNNLSYLTPILQPYSCLEGPTTIITYPILRFASGVIINYPELAGVRIQHYLCTVDYLGDGLADDPEQYKTHNIVVLENTKQLAALPNNFIRWTDNWFADDSTHPNFPYIRQKRRYFPGG